MPVTVAVISGAGRGTGLPAGRAVFAGATRPPLGTTSRRAAPLARSASCSAGSFRMNSATRISTSWARSAGSVTGTPLDPGLGDELAGELLQLVPQALDSVGTLAGEHGRDAAIAGVGDGGLVLPDGLPEDRDLDLLHPVHAGMLRLQDVGAGVLDHRVHDADDLRIDRLRYRRVVLLDQAGQPGTEVVDAQRGQVVRPGRDEDVVAGHDRGTGDHVEVGRAGRAAHRPVAGARSRPGGTPGTCAADAPRRCR